jgi:uncharacterized membrane protein YwzB
MFTDSFVVLDRLLVISLAIALGNLTASFKIQWFVYSQTGAYLVTALLP